MRRMLVNRLGICIASVYLFMAVASTTAPHSYAKNPLEDIASSITFLQERVSNRRAQGLALSIDKYSKKYNIEWDLIVAILFKESSFIFEDHQDVSYCLMGINYDVWREELSIDLTKLILDTDYCIELGTSILSILNTKYSTKDKQWFGRYNSRWKRPKQRYFQRISEIRKLIAENLRKAGDG